MAGETSAIRGTFFDFVDDPWNHVGAAKSRRPPDSPLTG